MSKSWNRLGNEFLYSSFLILDEECLRLVMRTLEYNPVVRWVKRITLYEATTFNSIPSNLIYILSRCVNLRYYIDHTVSLGFPLMSVPGTLIPPRLTSIDMQSPRLEDMYGIAAFQTLETFRARSLYEFRSPGDLLPAVDLPQLRFLEFDFMDPHGLEQQIINNWVSRWSLPKLTSLIFGGHDVALAVHTHLPKLSILGLGGTPIPPPGHIVLAGTVSVTRFVALHDFRSSSWANLGSFVPLRSVKRIEVMFTCLFSSAIAHSSLGQVRLAYSLADVLDDSGTDIDALCRSLQDLLQICTDSQITPALTDVATDLSPKDAPNLNCAVRSQFERWTALMDEKRPSVRRLMHYGHSADGEELYCDDREYWMNLEDLAAALPAAPDFTARNEWAFI